MLVVVPGDGSARRAVVVLVVRRILRSGAFHNPVTATRTAGSVGDIGAQRRKNRAYRARLQTERRRSHEYQR
jgi:hypothetical protein